MQILMWVTEKALEGADGGDAPSIVSTVCPTPHAMPKQLPSLVHDERGNTLYEEPSIAWMHIRISQVGCLCQIKAVDRNTQGQACPHARSRCSF